MAFGLAGSTHAQQSLSLTLSDMFEMSEERNHSMAVMDMAVDIWKKKKAEKMA